MARIYTGTGDGGTTSLFGGKRVPKDHLRIEAYGTVDELSAVMGLARSFSPPRELDAILGEVQNELFTLGADLATPPPKEIRRISSADAARLERHIDAVDAGLPPLATFILPGGSQAASALHLARTVCRRAERRVVALARQEKGLEAVLVYLNRLSDLLFVLARAVNASAGEGDVPWDKKK